MTPIRKGLLLAASVLADAVEQQIEDICKSYFAAMRLEVAPGIPDDEADAIVADVTESKTIMTDHSRERFARAVEVAACYGAQARSLVETMVASKASGNWVYFIQAGKSGPIKIGTTRDIEARLRELQTSNHEELRLLTKIPGDATLERALHEAFATCRLRGEWFDSKHLTNFVWRLSA